MVSIRGSVADGRLYVRKKQFDRSSGHFPKDHEFANVLSPSKSSRLSERIGYDDDADALCFDYCNGGDLRHLMDCYTARWELIPEEFIWFLFGRTISLVAQMRFSWVKGEKLPESRASIHHRDLFVGNLLLHWPDYALTNYKFPNLLVCDWGRSRLFSQGLDDGESVDYDFHSVIHLILTLSMPHQGTRLDSLEEILDSVELLSYSTTLKQLLADLVPFLLASVPKPKFTLEFVKRLISLADDNLRAISESDASNSQHYEWIRSVFNNQPSLFRERRAYRDWVRN